MPLLQSTYTAPLALLNGHVHTVVSGLLRKVSPVVYSRERINTADGDFLDLDWSRKGSRSVAILSHGLEGNSHRPYIMGMVAALNEASWDVVAWNYRGCSGEPNDTARLYHSGDTDDLSAVVNHVLTSAQYDNVALIGFSLGGNITLKYLGESVRTLPPELKAAVCFSVSCDLRSSAYQLSRPHNQPFMKLFLRSLRQKVREKISKYPHAVFDKGLEKISNFLEFDESYTAPMHGFASAEEYWQKCSSRKFLSGIKIPTLLVNAADDPMLSSESYPFDEAKKSKFLTLEVPQHGGHLGFARFNKSTISLPTFNLSSFGYSLKNISFPNFNFETRFWSELRVVEYLAHALKA